MSIAQQEDQGITKALRVVGLEVSSIYDLVNSRNSYPEAIPVLVEFLQQGIVDDRIKEGVIRALCVKEARGVASRPLLEEFRKQPPEKNILKWIVANTLSVVADESVLEDIIQLVLDKRHGTSREMLAVALGNMTNPRAVDVLIDLLEDEEVAGHALTALGKLKARRAREYIERFVSHPKSWIRNEASRALRKLDK